MAARTLRPKQRLPCGSLDSKIEDQSRCNSTALGSLSLGLHSSSETTEILKLPAELRLELYETISKPGYHRTNDEFDIARFVSFDAVPSFELQSRKSYSWILSHRLIFTEAMDIICTTHPIVFYDLDDIRRCRDLIQLAKHVVLDVEKVPLNPIRQALHRLSHLPYLERLEIRASPSNIGHIRISPEMGGFPALVSARIFDRRLHQEEHRHANQYHLEVKLLREQVGRLDEEIQIRESRRSLQAEAENVSVAVRDYDRLDLWSTAELYFTKHDLQLKMQWCTLQNTPESYSGAPEREAALHHQNALLKRDLALRRGTLME